MPKKILTISILMNTLLLSSSWAIDQMWATDQAAREARDQEHIYGSDLMTDQERAEYREKIHAASSEDEREKIRREHHDLMRERAKARGITLPDDPHPNMGHRDHRRRDHN